MRKVPAGVEYAIRALTGVTALVGLLYCVVWCLIVASELFSPGAIHFMGGDPDGRDLALWGAAAVTGLTLCLWLIMWALRPTISRRRGATI